MEFIFQLVIVVLASISTFFSGFGLGTIMLPTLMLTYDPKLAILLTAIIHLSNNIFKFALLRKDIATRVLLYFGIPSIILAFLGAEMLEYLAADQVILERILGVIIIGFALFDFVKKKAVSIGTPIGQMVGGGLSGFFGGLSGHQGAIRSAFLINTGLDKTSYIATGTALSLFIDLTRIPIYISNGTLGTVTDSEWLWQTIALVVFALLGSLVGKRYLKKTTNKTVRLIVSIALLAFGIYMLFK